MDNSRMGGDTEFKKGYDSVPFIDFRGKRYYLYKGERYYSKGVKRLHRVVFEYYKGEIPEGYEVHHINEDTTDNRIENLALVERSLHARFTGKQRVKNNPEWFKEFHRKGIEKAKEWHKSNEGREWHKQHGKNCWKNKPYRKLKCSVCGKDYETRHSGESKYCHNNCKAKAFRKRRREERLRLND